MIKFWGIHCFDRVFEIEGFQLSNDFSALKGPFYIDFFGIRCTECHRHGAHLVAYHW